ncbi:MAG: 23S rRNA (uracil(1939)-C(5))-methyltransferase RlmD [Gammaproteobacteria bacterium]|nr:23S rRNA (uracil(1939)-C(5))-methyltransferase RlmD [Gammaproteobacteria bacterium]
MARRSRRNKTPEPFEVEIESLSHEGRGIARVDGKTLFVFGALAGEKVIVRITKTNKKYDEARVLEVLTASPMRIEPKCDYFGLCGGCSMQHMSREDQLNTKQSAVLEMAKHAGLNDFEVIPALLGDSWSYRQKARLGVKFVIKKDKALVGFREKNSPFLTDMDSCEVLHPKVGKAILDLKNLVESLEAKQTIPQIEVAADDSNVTLVFRHLEPLSEQDLNSLTQYAKESGFYLQLQPKGPDSIHNLYPAEQQLLLKPASEIEIEFKATDFTQVNADMNRSMIQQAMHFLDPKNDEKVLDLFCGLGNFSLPIAKKCGFVTGVEGSEVMAQRATENAQKLGLNNTAFYAADLTQDHLGSEWIKQKFDKILLDPPRTGAMEVVEKIDQFGANKIVYISCQPTTLIRDAVILLKKGYKLTHLGVMDMFPQTAHVESMAVFDKV